MQIITARKKAGPVTRFVFFDPERAEELGPQLGLEKERADWGTGASRYQWWYHDDRSHFHIPVGHMVPLNAEGKACGFVGSFERFAQEYELMEEEDAEAATG